jgi:hypothetical protein
MTIGIIGSGAIGAAFATTLARAGIEAIISNSRGPDSLQALVRELGPTIKAGRREEAASADMVFVAVNWTKLPATLSGLPGWGGRIVIDAPARASSRRSTTFAPRCWPAIRRPTAASACCSIPATTPRHRPTAVLRNEDLFISSMPQDSSVELMFEVSMNCRPRLSAVSDFVPNVSELGLRIAFECVASD